jgi:hypothetical protein
LLTTLQNLGEGTGDGGVVAEEIELGRPSRGGGGWLDPAWEGGAPGVGFLCGGAGGEGGREDAEGLLTGDGECRMAGDGAAAGFSGGGT